MKKSISQKSQFFVVSTEVKSRSQRLAMHELPSVALTPPLPASCALPLSPSLTCCTTYASGKTGMIGLFPMLLQPFSCRCCLLRCTAAKATATVVVITFAIGWLLLLFIVFCLCCGVAERLPMPCCHCFFMATFAGCCATVLLIPLLLVAALQCCWCTAATGCCCPDRRHPLILASSYQCFSLLLRWLYHCRYYCHCSYCCRLHCSAGNASSVAARCCHHHYHFCQLIVA